MRISCRGLALLTGVSVSALALPAPAFAATSVSPGIGHSDTTDPVSDTLVICDLDDSCFYGVEASGEGSVSAIVNSVATGRIEQTGASLNGDVELEIVNEGDAEIAAHAAATAGDTGVANARAAIFTAVLQSGVAADDVVLEFTNVGELLIDAVAIAEGGETGAAQAFATIETAILQAAVSTGGAASAELANSGDLRIAATAVATGSGTGATASGASVAAFAEVKGITQVAVARDVETVTETTAGGNVIQTYHGFPVGPASVSLANSGNISMSADASAQGENFALARATLTAVHQIAEGAEAIVELDNSGTIELAASAAASGTTYALAAAFVDGFHQTANAVETIDQNVATPLGGYTHTFAKVPVGNASVALNNSGSIEIAAIAHAIADPAGTNAGTSVGAVAGAYASGILQNVLGAEASAEIVNSGTLAVLASAIATGEDFAAAQVNAIGMHQIAAATGFSYSTVAGPTGTPTFTSVFLAVGPATATFENSGEIDVIARAEAHGDSQARVDSTATGLWQRARGLDATVSIDNSGTVNVAAEGEVSADDAFAFVRAGGFIQQGAIADELASAQIGNSGELGVAANASVIGETSAGAIAIAVGISQLAVAFDSAIATLDNSGAIAVEASIDAEGGTFAGGAALAIGAQQSATANDVQLNIDNSGSITVGALIDAVAGVSAAASALAIGVQQTALASNAQLNIDNSGTIAVEAAIDLEEGVSAAGSASATGLGQAATALDAQLGIDNSGTIAVAASIDVEAGTFARGSALAIGARQSAFASDVQVDFDNSGDLTVTAEVNAAANDSTGLAMATAAAFGIGQVAFGAAANQSVDNSGSIEVQAIAAATAPSGADDDGVALAFALAYGVQQLNGGTSTAAQSLANSGTIQVSAIATADAAAGSATASAAGLRSLGIGGGPLDVTIENEGEINATASAVAVGKAYALARGIYVNNAPDDVGGTPVTGTIDNSGSISVVAQGSGQTFSEVIGTGTTATTLVWGGSSVFATGILVFGGADNMTITNSGSINVDAIAADGGAAFAAGIVALSNAPTATSPDDVLTINNSGDIIVRQSVDGGETWSRGLAIEVAGNPDNNVLGAANRTVVNLLGGNIYGNIAIQDGDEINVEDGTTYFDGIINPAFMPAGGITGADLDAGLFGVGTLNIGAGGNLILADPRLTGDPGMYDGPAYAFVETFNMDADGTITFELRPTTGGNQPIGTYPQIYADVANLDGTLVADITFEGGIFENSYFWNNVIDANTRNGTFDECVINGINTDSPLLEFSGCIYDNANNVDLGLTRIAFDEVDGLTPNQGAVAGGIECLYDDLGPAGLIGTPFGDNVVAELFLFDADDYPLALEQLTGASYASYLQSFNTLGYHYNQILDRATDCEIPALAGSALACRVAPMHLWGQVDYDTLDKDGDENLAGGYDADRWSFLVGFDVSVSPAAVIGASIGKVSNKVEHDWNNARIKGDGWQLGLYGVYDPGQFYVKALGTYTTMDGDARRDIDFRPFGGTLNGRLDGDPDTRMWTFGLHGGYRIAMGETSVITPFLNYDYTDVKLKRFTETGLAGPELTVTGGREKHSWLTGGVKFAGQMGGLVPEAKIGYRHMFGDRTASFNAAFMGDEDCDFDIVSMTEKRGAIIAGLSVGGKLGMVDVRVGYDGAFNSDMKQHSGFLKLVVPLGAVAVPPPPPVVVAPPPPPAPATQVCPDGSVILATDICPAPPPPPPPPAPAPERG